MTGLFMTVFMAFAVIAAVAGAVAAVFSALAWARGKERAAEKFEDAGFEDGEARRRWDEGVAGILGYSPDRGRRDGE